MSIEENLRVLGKKISEIAAASGRNPAEISLVAVSKSSSSVQILEAYASGCRDFGESRVQEFLSKKEELPKDIRWHFIGRIQTNKISKLIGHCALIHSVPDTIIAEKISEMSVDRGIVTEILLQVNASEESSKSGWDQMRWRENFKNVAGLPNLLIKGLMTMAPLTNDQDLIKDCFYRLRALRDALRSDRIPLRELSMGMSHDYPIAIEEGATLLRVGSAIFNRL